jgi:hypothetical protein
VITRSQIMMKIHPFTPWREHPDRCLVCGRRRLTLRHLPRDTGPDAWLGWLSDPAETNRFCAWLRLGRHWRIYFWPWRIRAYKDP